MARDRLIKSVSATANANGLATFQLGPAELGFVYQGTVQVPNAPSGALFVATVLGTNWGQWAGPTNYGPIQLWGGEFLTVSATGLTPSTQYTMTYFGISLSEEEAEPLPPSAPMSVVGVETTTTLVNGKNFSVTGAGNTLNFTVPSLTRRLTLVFQRVAFNNVVPLYLTGDTSGITYWTAPLVASPGNTVPQVFYAAIEPSIDASYTLRIAQAGTGSVNVWILASTSNPLVMNNQYMPLFVTFGSGSGAPLPFPTTGNPTINPFNTAFTGVFNAGANQAVLAAPGGGLSIYIQSVSVANIGAVFAAGQEVGAEPHAAGGNIFCSIDILGTSKQSDRAVFPGGFKLPDNTALQVDITSVPPGQQCRFSTTYTIGSTV